jgi:hypothetical protein
MVNPIGAAIENPLSGERIFIREGTNQNDDVLEWELFLAPAVGCADPTRTPSRKNASVSSTGVCGSGSAGEAALRVSHLDAFGTIVCRPNWSPVVRFIVSESAEYFVQTPIRRKKRGRR